IKPATSPLIRRFGFRWVLIGSVTAGAVVIAVLGLVQATTSLLLLGGLLLLSGVFRSIGFSAYNSLQFADITGTSMTGANTLSATLQQLAGGLGVAVGALLLRTGEHLVPDSASGTAAYAYAFVGLALIMIIPLVQAWRLDPSSGSELAVRR
ncbi:MAG TPA: MFS transporter, partial [Microlunatus sp.]|nr:MFS transporter [Microlunatus sp.]